MKKLIYFFATTFFVSFAHAQQYAVYSENGCQSVDAGSMDISGSSLNASVNVGTLSVVKFYFRNMSGSAKDVAVIRKRICVPVEWSDGLCWAPGCTDPLFQGGCYTSAQMTTNPWTSPYITIENDSLGELISDVHVEVTSGGGHYRYYFSTVSEILDSVDLVVNGGCNLGIGEKGQEIGLSVYPNPANDELTVSTFGISGNRILRVTDISGKIVYEDNVNEIQTIQTGSFRNGVYLVSILENESILQTRRIVIKH